MFPTSSSSEGEEDSTVEAAGSRRFEEQVEEGKDARCASECKLAWELEMAGLGLLFHLQGKIVEYSWTQH